MKRIGTLSLLSGLASSAFVALGTTSPAPRKRCSWASVTWRAEVDPISAPVALYLGRERARSIRARRKAWDKEGNRGWRNAPEAQMNRMRWWLVASLACGLALGSAGRAGAEPITFEFAGTVDGVFDGLGALGGLVQVGTPFTGSYTFDSETRTRRRQSTRGRPASTTTKPLPLAFRSRSGASCFGAFRRVRTSTSS